VQQYRGACSPCPLASLSCFSTPIQLITGDLGAVPRTRTTPQASARSKALGRDRSLTPGPTPCIMVPRSIPKFGYFAARSTGSKPGMLNAKYLLFKPVSLLPLSHRRQFSGHRGACVRGKPLPPNWSHRSIPGCISCLAAGDHLWRGAATRRVPGRASCHYRLGGPGCFTPRKRSV